MIDGEITSKLKSRRALEALRNGVPNGDAVAALGCSQPDVEREFHALLSRVSNEGDAPNSSAGMLVAGDFGSGKSHLLGYLETQALAENFVCSRVVISKETPLFDMDKVFKAAVENGRAPGITGHLVDEMAHIGQAQAYSFRAPAARDLPPQRLRFLLELIKAAGYAGWVVLMDEIELVANYSVLQRARSYAELARWMGQSSGEEYPGLVLVGTVTADFASVVLDEKEDRDKAAPRLRARQREEDNIAAARAETGMRLIERGVHALAEPDDAMLSDLYNQLRAIHSEGYNWAAPDIDHGIGRGGRRRIRSSCAAGSTNGT